MTTEWEVLVPVKVLAEAKTRIELTPQARSALVLAMCRDVVTAALASTRVARVRVVSPDARVAEVSSAHGALAHWVPGRRLNEDLEAAAGELPRHRGTAVILADVPCLTSELITELLEEVASDRSAHVPDMQGSGTTILLAPPGVSLAPRFGPGSETAHRGVASPILGEKWRAARRDVDTLGDLQDASELGLGPYTTAVFEALELACIKYPIPRLG